MTDFKARPTVYKGVRMRSRLEATFAQRCDENGETWEYEPNRFGNELGQYLPDFKVTAPWVPNRPCYVEVKPFVTQDMRIDWNHPRGWACLMERMAIIWSSEPNCDLMLWTPTGSRKSVHTGSWEQTHDQGDMVCQPNFVSWLASGRTPREERLRYFRSLQTKGIPAPPPVRHSEKNLDDGRPF